MFGLKINKKGHVAVQKQIRFQPNRAFLNKVAKVILDEIVREAKVQAARDAKRGGGYRPFVEEQYENEGVPEGIPRSKKFFDSFQYRIAGGSKIEIFSDWPWIDQIVEGRDPYKMGWLTKAKGIETVPFQDPLGKVIFRSTPNDPTKAWIHPGFAKHDFISVGWGKAMPKVKKMYALEAFKEMKKKAFG